MLENKYFKKCLGGACMIGGIFIIAIIVNSIVRGDSIDPNKEYGPDTNYDTIQIEMQNDSLFVPTVNDMMVLDTIEHQVNTIEKDIDTLHIRINRIEDKIDELIIEQAK
jgi:hypothetical protein